MPITLDSLNPKFTFFSPVESVPIDRRQLAEHVDRAIIAFDGRAPIAGDCCLELLYPVASPGTLRIEIWVTDLDEYTCTYGFVVMSGDGRTPYARGERVVVNLDPRSRRAEKWSSDFRQEHLGFLKDLPAYA